MKEENEYYNILKGEKYMFYKGDNLLKFMSNLKANLLYKYNQHIFIDEKFYATQISSYLVKTIRLLEINKEKFCTVGYSILTDRTTENYVEY